MSFPRSLTATERSIAWNLSHGADVPELDVLEQQLRGAQAASGCECVCPTISIEVDRALAAAVSYSGKPVATADYAGGSVMVWIEGGWLSHLEIYWFSDEAPTEFPPLSELSNHRPG